MRSPASATQSVSQCCLLAAVCGSQRHSFELRLLQQLLLILAACCSKSSGCSPDSIAASHVLGTALQSAVAEV